MYGVWVEIYILCGYFYLENDFVLICIFFVVVCEFLGVESVEELLIWFILEDFLFYLQEILVCFFWLGVCNELQGIVYGVYYFVFDIDDQVFIIGMQVMVLVLFL